MFACQKDPDLWFSTDPDDQAGAAQACFFCPRQEACADYGRAEEFGVWGGTLPAERRHAVLEARRHNYDSTVRVSPATCYLVWHGHLRGDTYAELADDHGLTLNRVRTIVKNRGVAA